MTQPMALSMAQEFELERMTRTIDGTSDPETLRNLAKLLLKSWHTQKAATEWMMRKNLVAPMQGTGKSGFPAQGPVRPIEPNQRS
jgi:hypothetical protein